MVVSARAAVPRLKARARPRARRRSRVISRFTRPRPERDSRCSLAARCKKVGMRPDHDQSSNCDPLSEIDLALVARILEIEPSSSQLIAALHETFARELGVEIARAETGGVEAGVRSPASEYGAEVPVAKEPTLYERARQIDPLTAGFCNAAWGEWITPWERPINLAPCWYQLPDHFDFVPDGAMRDAWPEFASLWEVLRERGWERHQLARRPVESPRLADYDGSPF